MASWPNRLRTARAQSTIAATAVVAVALILAGVAAVTLQRRSLMTAIDTALMARVDDVSALIIDGVVPADLAVSSEDNALVQILDSQGSVVSASSNIGGEEAVALVQLEPGTEIASTQRLPIGEGEFRIIARSLSAHGQTFTVFAASSLEPVRESATTLRAILLVGEPLLIGFVGLVVWLIVGRTLQPVEAIRTQVASIGDRQLDLRVPVPDVDDEIGRLAATMNQMLDRLESAASQQRSFVADVSHELRSPLAAIRAQLEVPLAHQIPSKETEMTAAALDETLRMQRLVDDLLLLARRDSGALPPLTSDVDIDDLIFAQAAQARSTTEKTIDTSRVSGAQIRGDEDGLAKLTRNLLDNAVRHATERVEVALDEADAIVTLTVEDDGPGIPESERDRLFERFARLQEARDRDHGGAGLGLAIAREIADQHNGTIGIDMSPLGGARFTVTLPTRPSSSG